MRLDSAVKGFTLIELLIVLAIVAILAGIAVPTYRTYTSKAYYTQIIEASAPYALGVNLCYQTQLALTNCNGGSNGIPANITTAEGGVGSLTVSHGIITVTPVAQHGILATDTYVLTPTITNNTVQWAVSGGCVTEGYC
jgi:type IV pilus assembly protein PilA